MHFYRSFSLLKNQAGGTTVCLGLLPRSTSGGGVRGSADAVKLALCAVIPVPSSKVMRAMLRMESIAALQTCSSVSHDALSTGCDNMHFFR
jgi:hypothetical protein